MNLQEGIRKVRNIPGDAAEFGCFEGERTLQIAREFARVCGECGCSSPRRVWAWDTFSGMPDDNYIEDIDKENPPGKWTPHNNPLVEFVKTGLHIVPVVGLFSTTIPAFENMHPEVRFAFVHIDCDHYWAYKRVLEFIASRMSPGGLVKLDDLGCAGAKKATDEWLAATGKTLDGDWIRF
jgi:O-methyltransferase